MAPTTFGRSRVRSPRTSPSNSTSGYPPQTLAEVERKSNALKEVKEVYLGANVRM